MSEGPASPPAVPVRTPADGRVSLAYPLLDLPWLAHGTVVFKDPGFESRGSDWRRLVADFISRNLSPAPRRIVIPIQVHGSRVVTVGPDSRGEKDGRFSAPECDGLVTSAGGMVVGVNTADCVPLMAVNEAARVVGVAHCGWRGISAGMVEEFAGVLDAAAGERDRAQTRFIVGASVGACCYDVGDDLLGSFSEGDVSVCAAREGGRVRFDLKRLVRLRLINRGIDRGSVFIDNTCTSCESDTLCSYRAEREACGRMYTYLMITC